MRMQTGEGLVTYIAKMKNKRLLLYVMPLLLIITILWSALPLHTLRPDWRLESEPLHSTMEAVGALAGVLMAVVLLNRGNEGGSKFFPLGLGFLGMGLLDGFHAISVPGGGFVLLHSAAVLVGSVGFAFVWLPESYRYVLSKYLPQFVATGSILFGIWTLLFPETLPAMVRNGEFTTAAVAINLLSGVLFLTGAGRLILDFRRSEKTEDYLFFIIALLFGLAGLTFKYSALWKDEWWFWHVLRLMAFLVVLGFLIKRHQQTVLDLKDTLIERRRAEEKIIKLNRLYSVLSNINQAIVRIRDQQKLLEEVCRITVEQGLFGMAWIGLIDPDAQEFRPVAHSGFVEGYLDNIRISVTDASESREPTGTAIREGGHFVFNDIKNDRGMLPWRAEALKRGYRSYAAFSLRAGKHVAGAFSIYAPEPEYFDEEIVNLLKEVATEISFALESIEQEKRRKKAEEALQKAHRRLSVLYSIDRAASQSLNLNEIITDALNATMEVLGREHVRRRKYVYVHAATEG